MPTSAGDQETPTGAAPRPDGTPQTEVRAVLTRAEQLWAHRRLRELGMTQGDLADRMGVKHPTVVKWLQQQRGMGVLQRRALVEALGAEGEGVAAPPESPPAELWSAEPALGAGPGPVECLVSIRRWLRLQRRRPGLTAPDVTALAAAAGAVEHALACIEGLLASGVARPNE